MATTIRPELSEKNPYWIEKHRYYELKHFCLQYPIWRKAYASLNSFSSKPADWAMFIVTSTLGDPTAKVGIARAYYSERTDMIERVAEQTDQQLAPYILKAVTEGWWSFSWQSGNLYEIFKWYDEHSKYIKLAQTTKITVEYILDNMKKKLQTLQHADQSAMQPGA